MKASLTRNLIIALTLGVFCFLGITPSRAQSSGSAGGCCGSQATSNPTTGSSAAANQGVSMTCGAGETEVTTSAGLQCVSSSAVSTTNSTSH